MQIAGMKCRIAHIYVIVQNIFLFDVRFYVNTFNTLHKDILVCFDATQQFVSSINNILVRKLIRV